MNASTTEILQRFGLPQTETLTLREAAACPAEQRFYMRYRTGCGFANSRISAAHIRQEFDVLLRRFDAGELITCERCYDTIVGGISLVKADFIYSEFVLGHSNVLLRRGCCGARLLQKRSEKFYLLRPNQKWSAEQREEYIYRPANGPDAALAEQTRQKLLCLSGIPLSDLFLEWMWTTAGFFFCDAHFDSGAAFGDALPSIWSKGSHFVAVKSFSTTGAESAKGHVHIDALDCEKDVPADDGDTVVCINGALLSHFVTRAIKKNVRIFWAESTALLPS